MMKNSLITALLFCFLAWKSFQVSSYSSPFISKSHLASLSASSVKNNAFNDYIVQILSSNDNSVIIIDGDNVRGKTKFSMSKEDLVDKVNIWSKITDLNACIIIMFDHGSEHAAFYHKQNSFVIVFSGPILKADDVIARDIPYYQEHLNCSVVAVVTEDVDLKKRCRKNSISSPYNKRKSKKENKRNNKVDISIDLKDRKLMTIDSTKFADILLQISPTMQVVPVPSTTTTTTTTTSTTNINTASDKGGKEGEKEEEAIDMSTKLHIYRRNLEEMVEQGAYMYVYVCVCVCPKPIYMLYAHVCVLSLISAILC